MAGSVFRIVLWSVCLLASTTISHGQPLSAFASQDSGSLLAGKNQIGDSAKSIIENVSFSSSAAVGARPSLSPKAAASVEPKQITSTLNGFGSSKQVAKSTPPPSKVQFLKRFDPYDGSTTTINPNLVTLPGGRVQTSTTENWRDFTSTTPAPTTTKKTTITTSTTTTPRPTTTTSTTTYRPTVRTTTYRPTTTTYRPIVYSTATTTHRPLVSFAPVPSSFGAATASATKKPFDIFEFYRSQYNPTKPPPLTYKPFAFSNSQFQAPAKPTVVPQFNQQHQAPVQKTVFKPQSFDVPAKPVALPQKPPTPITSSPIASATPNLSNNIFAVKEHTKPVPVASFVAKVPQVVVAASPVLPVQSLEKSVAPPLPASQTKVTLHPNVNVQLKDSGHTFINRFVVDEDEFRPDGLLPVKSNLDKEVVAPPVKNVRPILSPKISVHVGETGQKFINRFVLTEEEKRGQNKIPSKSLIKEQQVAVKPVQTVAVNPGQTAFTSRFAVDDVNKKLFQTQKQKGFDSPPIRAPQSHIQFNNRFGDGVNVFHYQLHGEGGAISGNDRAAFARTLDKTAAPLFSRLSSPLPSFDHFKAKKIH